MLLTNVTPIYLFKKNRKLKQSNFCRINRESDYQIIPHQADMVSQVSSFNLQRSDIPYAL